MVWNCLTRDRQWLAVVNTLTKLMFIGLRIILIVE
jgi:hypothetical protein